MAQEKPPLSDLSFFRFPEVTGEVVRNITLFLLLLVLTVLVTIALQRRVQDWLHGRSRRERFQRVVARDEEVAPELRTVVQRLMALAGARDEFAFLHDAEAFETAAELLAGSDSDADLEALARLRRTLHLNVMNPEQRLISTRQLLQDLPVRVMTSIDGEKLDLYCGLLRVDERYLIIDLPHEEELFELLRDHPRVLLIYWRERDGEALFRVTLEPIQKGRLVLFRARHALRDLEAEQRSDFRLSVELPVFYQYLERDALTRARPRPVERRSREGEGLVTDVGHGGASLLLEEPLEPNGLAQLDFDLHGQRLQLLLEVLSSQPLPGGRFLVRGQFRGLGEGAHARLRNVLHREQLKRLRDKELVRVRAGA